MYSKSVIDKLLRRLDNHGFQPQYFADQEAATVWLAEQITSGMEVGIPGSVTLQNLGIADIARQKGAIVWEHGAAGISPEEADRCRLAEGRCDLFFTSVNALTVKGDLVNCDGRGNRVSAMLYGPRRVIVVAGINKLCEDLEAALERIEKIAGPQNSQRLHLDNPCVQTGYCMDCNSATRVCRGYVILKRPMMGQDMSVVLINEELGY